MGTALAIAGWLAFGAVTAAAMLVRHALASRSEAVARACHEVRGSLTAARLGLEWGNRAAVGSRLGSLELELDRAVAALDDLQGVDRDFGPTGALVDVEGWVGDSVEAFRPLALALGVELTVAWRGSSAQVWGRRARLAQASDNLIANAIEHGGSPVEVRGQIEAGRVVIEVVDQGPGIGGDVLGWLEGGRSRRLRRWGHASGGNRGRGLAIVRDVVAEHGGRLGARPSAQGARLVLELPLAKGTSCPARPTFSH
jgi:signal transduction histidine kinase